MVSEVAEIIMQSMCCSLSHPKFQDKGSLSNGLTDLN